MRAVVLVAGLDRLHLGAPSKAASAAICDSVGTEIARFCCSRSIGRTSGSGSHHPADPPAGHAEVLGERVDDDRVASRSASAVSRRKRIVEAVIDFVGDEADAGILGGARSAPPSASAVIMVPVGLAGLAISTPASGVRAMRREQRLAGSA